MRAWITTLTIGWMLGLTSADASAQQATTTRLRGTKAGLVEADPAWSAGVQLGNYGATGLTAQRVAFKDGAVNLTLGMNFGGVTLSGDYLVLFDENFTTLTGARALTYNGFREQLTPFVGGGLQIDDGISLRLPAGVQYTMATSPFNFYGGVVVTLGRFMTKYDDKGLWLWLQLGARVLL